jgi:hypothetical protein
VQIKQGYAHVGGLGSIAQSVAHLLLLRDVSGSNLIGYIKLILVLNIFFVDKTLKNKESTLFQHKL